MLTDELPEGFGRRLTRAVWWLAGASLLLGITALTFSIWHDYKSTIEEGRRTQGEILRLMAEHTRAILEADAIVLNRMEELVHHYGLAELAHNPQAQQRLLNLMTESPKISSLWILDRNGEGVVTTIPNVLRLNYQDRDYFQIARNSPQHSDYISPLIVGRVSGKAIFSVNRRLSDAEGQFIGVLQVNVSADDFARTYAKVSAEAADSFGLFKQDGSIVFRQPLPSEAQQTDKARETVVSRTRGGERGSYIGPSVFDGVERLFGYHIMPDAGLILTAGRPLATVLTPWRERTLRNGAWMAVGLAVIGFLALAGIRAARRAEDAQRCMVEALRSRATFFASASHDLRQPYQALRLFWSVAEQHAKSGSDPKLKTAIQHMGAAMATGEQLLSALLDVAVLEVGRVASQPQRVAVREIIEAEVDNFRALAHGRGLRLRWVDTAARVTTDPALLRRIVRNLLVNAIKFTERGGVLLGCRRRGGDVVLEVWDSGKGIAVENQKAVFDDLVQLDNPSRTRSEGLGLGLSIVTRTAVLLGCKIGLRSLPGRGSVFSVTLQACED